MSSEAYELLAMLMRYIFIALGVVILFRAFRQMRRDNRQYKKEMRRLPDAGLIGEVVDLETGKSQPLPREGMMGASSSCDIRLRRRGVKKRHALFDFVEGKGLRITPHMGHKVAMEGVPLKGSAYALHGTEVTLGSAHIRIRLFAGLNVPHPAMFAKEQLREGSMPEEETFVLPNPFDAVPAAQPASDYAAYEAQEQPGENAAYLPYGQMPVYQQPLPAEENDEAIPYFSPVERHRRSGRR